MKRRVLLGVVALVLLLLAWKLPTAWYDSLPRQEETPPLLFRGVDLLRVTFLVEAIVFAWLAMVDWRYEPTSPSERLTPAVVNAPFDLSSANARTLLIILTIVGAFLRAYHLGSDLWLDEISPVVDYGPMPFVQVMGSYLRTNNHLLNTLLFKLSIGVFGESEWAIRLPAVLFGVATIPAMYWLSRTILSRWASVGAAAILTASYHHVFFSQNARGYSAYLFFSIIATALLIRAISEDRPWQWILYVLAMVFGFASLANMAFVFAGHAVVATAAVIRVRRSGGRGTALARRLTIVFAAAGFLSFQIYAAPLPEMYAVISHLYVREATGFAPFTMEFVSEIARGLAAGFGGILPAVVLVLIGLAGIAFLFVRNPFITSALALPPVLTAVFLLARGLSFSPRFFLLLIPLAVLTIMSIVEMSWVWPPNFASIRNAAHPRRAGIVGFCLAFASLFTLPAYYRTPKQPYRAAIQYIESVRTPGEPVVVIYAAGTGMKYYTRRLGVSGEHKYEYTRTLSAFDSLTRSGKALVVTTFPRVIRADLPDVSRRLSTDWYPQRVFPATIGGGEITVWSKK
jgi:hypothetical protein